MSRVGGRRRGTAGEGWPGSLLGGTFFGSSRTDKLHPVLSLQPQATGHPSSFPRPARHPQRRAQFFIDRKKNRHSTFFFACWQVTLDDHHTRQIDCCFLNICPSKFVRLLSFLSSLLLISMSLIHPPITPFSLKNEQSFNCISKDSSAAPIAISLGKGPPAEQQLFSPLAAFSVSCSVPCTISDSRFSLSPSKCVRPGRANKRRRQCPAE